MLTPDPALLRGLLEEYEAAAANEPADPTGAPGPRTRDLAYTLCVSTGTRDVGRAVAAARLQLADGATRARVPSRPTIQAKAPMHAPAGTAD
ncbi:DUF5133 domain-containing protein [Streptomyces sp. NPDC057245]|uniref:DUF5133 domain-containing protein n=1 Tax=Streptomyces TaxID=1883 RepID=UPI001C1DE741|nr:DUF5133 domain-containing protein [Streptomyces sp. A108]MBU6535208.1 DUF5133 domain-containing protein [Streptomyces sp. A108]